MRQVRMVLMMLVLSLFMGGGLYASYGGKTKAAKPASSPESSKMMKQPGEKTYDSMRVHHENAIAYARALDHYARKNEGSLRKDVFEQDIRGMDRGIVRAQNRLAKLDKRVGKGTTTEHEELARIRAHQQVAADAVTALKAEARKSPMDGSVIAKQAETIRHEMKKANDEARTLAIKLDFRNPGETEGRLAKAKPMESEMKPGMQSSMAPEVGPQTR